MSSRPVLFLSAALTLAGAASADPLTIFFIDPGYDEYSGDAILVLTPGGRSYLVDGGDRGSNPSWDCGEARIIPLLDSLGVMDLDGLVATHPHSDHIGGLVSVLGALPVATVWDSGWPYSSSALYEEFLAAVEQSGAQYVVPRRGDILDWGQELVVEVLHPADPLDPGNMNNASIVLRISYGQTAFLLTGDLETEGGESVVLAALSSGEIETVEARVLKVGHHGSTTSTSTQWLAAVDPDWAAIEVGAGNPYGHPHGEIIARLMSRGIDIFRTDTDGTFFISTDGSTLYLNSFPEEGGGATPGTGLLVYPSPASSHAVLSWDCAGQSGTSSIRIVNLLGETVRTMETTDQTLDWDLSTDDGSLASPGLYAAVLEKPGGGRCIEYFSVTR